MQTGGGDALRPCGPDLAPKSLFSYPGSCIKVKSRTQGFWLPTASLKGGAILFFYVAFLFVVVFGVC